MFSYKKGMVGTVEVVLITIMIAIVGFVVWRVTSTNQETTTQFETTTEDDATEDTEEKTGTTNAIPSDWQLFESEYSGYTVAYPNSTDDCDGEIWEAVENPSDQEFYSEAAYFGPICSRPGGHIWGISVFPTSNLENEIANYGSQFNDRAEIRENIIVNGFQGILVTVTTASNPGWVSKHAILGDNGKSYNITNGAVDKDEFNIFYNSFEFTD